MLLLFAVLEFLMKRPQPETFAERLLTIRNLVFASGDGIRIENFPALLDETACFIQDGDLCKLESYNKRQIAEERQSCLSRSALRMLRPTRSLACA